MKGEGPSTRGSVEGMLDALKSAGGPGMCKHRNELSQGSQGLSRQQTAPGQGLVSGIKKLAAHQDIASCMHHRCP